MPNPKLDRSIMLDFVGDWGHANFHRICSWLTQEFCDRAGPYSRTRIWSIRGGGIESLHMVHDGEVDLCIVTPAMMMRDALSGKGIFEGRAMPGLRALASLPQNDALMLALDPGLGLKTMAELRKAKPKLKMAVSTDDGTNFIGYATSRFLNAHGLSRQTIESWGGEIFEFQRPDACLDAFAEGKVNAIVQEAIMTPWWRDLIEASKALPVAAETAALSSLETQFGWGSNTMRASYWEGHSAPVETLDFSDFLIVVREDMPEDVAHLLTWCIVETKEFIESQYRHIPPERSPLSWPLDPRKMAITPLELHPGAKSYYSKAGHI